MIIVEWLFIHHRCNPIHSLQDFTAFMLPFDLATNIAHLRVIYNNINLGKRNFFSASLVKGRWANKRVRTVSSFSLQEDCSHFLLINLKFPWINIWNHFRFADIIFISFGTASLHFGVCQGYILPSNYIWEIIKYD